MRSKIARARHVGSLSTFFGRTPFFSSITEVAAGPGVLPHGRSCRELEEHERSHQKGSIEVTDQQTASVVRLDLQKQRSKEARSPGLKSLIFEPTRDSCLVLSMKAAQHVSGHCGLHHRAKLHKLGVVYLVVSGMHDGAPFVVKVAKLIF